LALSIDYKLTGSGWAECTVADDDQSCTVTASYLSDAFGNLVLSAVTMLKWFNAVSFSFEEEPGEFKWELQSLPDNHLDVKLFEGYRDHGSTPHWKYKVIFEKTSTPLEFGRAVAAAGKALLEEYGEAGYLEKWVEFPFPTENFRQLDQLVTYWSQFPHIFPNERT
jgi:hypothetical protein